MNFPVIVETTTLTLFCFGTLVEKQHVTKALIKDTVQCRVQYGIYFKRICEYKKKTSKRSYKSFTRFFYIRIFHKPYFTRLKACEITAENIRNS